MLSKVSLLIVGIIVMLLFLRKKVIKAVPLNRAIQYKNRESN